MELKELYDNTLEIFDANKKNLGSKIMESLDSVSAIDAFVKMTGGDLTHDYMQMIYQYYLADRKKLKQDYTPVSLSRLISALAPTADEIVDMCAGSGALTIQRWLKNKDTKFILYELSDDVIPFLLFNMVCRNIDSIVFKADVLSATIYDSWRIRKGDKYGKISNIKSTIQHEMESADSRVIPAGFSWASETAAEK